MRTIIKVAENTGTRPFLCQASDAQQYWCKILHGAHGWEATLNEVITAMMGKCIGAPIRPWTFLDIPDSFAHTWVGGQHTNRYRPPSIPVFDSLHVHTANVTDTLTGIHRDSNYERFLRLIALWHLCNAADIQFLYDESSLADHTI